MSARTSQPARWYHVVAVQIVGATIIALALLAATVHAADLPLAWDAPTHITPGTNAEYQADVLGLRFNLR